MSIKNGMTAQSRLRLAQDVLHTPNELLEAASQLASRHSAIFDFTHDLSDQSILVRLMIAALSSGMLSLDRVRVKKAGGLIVDHVADEVMWTTAYFNRAKHSLSALQAESAMLLTLLRQTMFDHPMMQQHTAALKDVSGELEATFLRGFSNASAERVTASTEKRGVDFLWAADSSQSAEEEVDEEGVGQEDDEEGLDQDVGEISDDPPPTNLSCGKADSHILDSVRAHADSLRTFCASAKDKYCPDGPPPFPLAADGVPALWFSRDDDAATVIDGAIRVVAYAEQCEDERVTEVPSPFETIEWDHVKRPPSTADLAHLYDSLGIGPTPYTWLCMYCVHAYEGRLETCHLTGLPLGKVSKT